MENITPLTIGAGVVFGFLYLIQLSRFGQLDVKGNPLAKRWMSIWIVFATIPVILVVLTPSVPAYIYFLLIGIVILAEILIRYCKDYHIKQIQAKTIGTRDPAILYAAARNLGQYKQWAKAANIHQQIIELAPDFYEAYIDLAAIRGLNDDYEGAEELCRKAIEIKPDYANAHYYLGMASRGLKNYYEARDEIQTALKLGLPGKFLGPAEAILDELEAKLNPARR